mmetsp:Transcript_73276/g.236966  ORF Transcript_73276/g.236966 Transcript_73276/m.236966 type:complete len:237 (-) Transcript_73276:13-723(-)
MEIAGDAAVEHPGMGTQGAGWPAALTWLAAHLEKPPTLLLPSNVAGGLSGGGVIVPNPCNTVELTTDAPSSAPSDTPWSGEPATARKPLPSSCSAPGRVAWGVGATRPSLAIPSMAPIAPPSTPATAAAIAAMLASFVDSMVATSTSTKVGPAESCTPALVTLLATLATSMSPSQPLSKPVAPALTSMSALASWASNSTACSAMLAVAGLSGMASPASVMWTLVWLLSPGASGLVA